MASIYKRKDFWWLDYWAGGRRIRESTHTKNQKVAKRCLASRMGEVVQGKFKLEKVKQSPLFRIFSKEYLEWAKQNKRSWERDFYSVKELDPVFGLRKLRDIHSFHVESYRIRRKIEVAPATINREVACLKRILNVAIEWGRLQANPIREVKSLKEPNAPVRFLDEEEAARLVSACSVTLQPIVITAMNTGMRLNEILSLKWEKVNLRERFLTVMETKNGEPRQVLLNSVMVALFESLSRKGDHVFTNSHGKPYQCIRKIFMAALRKADIKNFRFHDLRHTWASWLVMRGVDLFTVMELGGWKSLSMVQRYAHLSSEHKRRAVEMLNGKVREQGTKPGTRSRIIEMAVAAN